MQTSIRTTRRRCCGRFTPGTGLTPASCGSRTSAGFPRADVRAVHRGKIGLDATAPLDMKDTFRRRRFPGIEAINPVDYFDPA